MFGIRFSKYKHKLIFLKKKKKKKKTEVGSNKQNSRFLWGLKLILYMFLLSKDDPFV